MSDYAVFEGKDFTVESNRHTTEEMAQAFGKPAEAAPVAHGATVAEGEDHEEGEPAAAAPVTTPEGEKPLGKPRNDMKARMLDATRKESEAKKRADEIERRASALEAELREIKARHESKAPEPPKEPKVEAKDGRPKLDDFETIEDHAEAVAEWVADRREKAARETQRTAAMEHATRERFSSFSQRMSEHVKTDPEYWSRQSDSVVGLKPFSALSQEERAKAGPLNALADHFLVSEKAPALIEYFSGKPEELQRLSTLHPGNFWRELGRIEERLGAAPTASAPQPVSKAAPPARPVTGGPPIGDSGPSASDSDDDYIRKRKAEELRKRTAARR